jgi:predicted aconitase with swiveling domain
VGAVIANIPMVDQIDIGAIKTGNIVEVDAYRGVVKVL